MTINKSQGQTIKNVGLYGEVFTHGQLYVAASRVKELKNFKLINVVNVKNIVYKEILN